MISYLIFLMINLLSPISNWSHRAHGWLRLIRPHYYYIRLNTGYGQNWHIIVPKNTLQISVSRTADSFFKGFSVPQSSGCSLLFLQVLPSIRGTVSEMLTSFYRHYTAMPEHLASEVVATLVNAVTQDLIAAVSQVSHLILSLCNLFITCHG